MPTTKSGEKITWKEFMSRWKKGIEGMTPVQKVTNELRGTFISLLGYIVSIIAVIWKREAIGLLAYGLILIFLGSIISTGLKYIALRQQLKSMKDTTNQSINIEDLLNKMEVKNG